jgi:Uma2 family endonuclease
MNVHAPPRLTVDEFLRWSIQQEHGRYELEAGRIIMQQSQNLGHVKAKQRAYEALRDALGRTDLPFYAMPDGPTVRISVDRAYEPDALVAPLPQPPDDELEISNPVIIVEVLSPTPASIKRDLTTKVQGYALVPSIAHYIVIDPVERAVLHFRRQGSVLVAPQASVEDTIVLDPPGLKIPITDILPARHGTI